MPRVSEEYKANKRREIIDAAHRICLRKPVGMVTMTDIINETGMAQGGIYRYFEDIDDIFRAMILDIRESYSITEKTDEIFKNAADLSVEEVADMICNMLADRMEEQLMDIQKINFDLSVLAINEPERTGKILGGIKSEGNLEHLTNHTGQMLGKAYEKIQDTKSALVAYERFLSAEPDEKELIEEVQRKVIKFGSMYY